jgi:hypothetical protein
MSTGSRQEAEPLDDGAAKDVGAAAPPAAGPGADGVVLAFGSSYFHDGRVGPGRYASDLEPTLVAAVAASHALLRAVFGEAGAPLSAPLEASCDRFSLRYGSEPGHAQLVELARVEPTAGRSLAKGADAWVRGVVAAREADHAQALAAFEREAVEAVEAGSSQRAAIAYRAAAAAATAAGRADHANRLLRLAGKAYLEIAEAAQTIPQGVVMAYRESARCFLEAGNLPLAHSCLSKALAIGETLGYMEAA